MHDLSRRIHAAQVHAGEQVVLQSLRERGLAEPDSKEEWELEQRAFGVANDPSLPVHVRDLVKDLWREVCARAPVKTE